MIILQYISTTRSIHSLVLDIIADVGPDLRQHENVPVQAESLLVHEVTPVGVYVPVTVTLCLLILYLRTQGGQDLNLYKVQF